MARINFVVNTTGLTGGIKMVFEYANRLMEDGNQVKIIYPYYSGNLFLAILKWLKFSVYKFFGNNGASWFPLKVEILRVPAILDRFMPSADVIIATANETADLVIALDKSKGRKYYFIQDYEIWTRSVAEVERTWKYDMKKIVVSKKLLKKAKELGVENSTRLVENGIDLRKFYPDRDDKKSELLKIIFIAHINENKGTSNALKVIKMIPVPVEVVIVSAYKKREIIIKNKLHEDLQSVINESQFCYKPSVDQLRRLYSDTDVFISSSLSEGWGLPAMEAMACGCACVLTRVGGVEEYTIPNKTALVVEPGAVNEMYNGVMKLINNQSLREEIAKAGLQNIQKFSLEDSYKKFEKIVNEYA